MVMELARSALAGGVGGRRPGLDERGRSERYSRFVGRAKLVLPSVAGLMLLALAGWPTLSTSLDRAHARFPKIDANQIRDLRMVNPRYTGLDKEQRPFTITAEAARQTGTGKAEGSDLVALDRPKADILSKEGTWILVSGNTGMYQPEAQFLDLFGEVTLFHDKGYRLTSQTARVDLAGGTAEGHDPVSGNGPSGSVQAEGFRILDKGDTVVFTGHSHLILNGPHDSAK